jgi:hypothetical protein
MRSSASREQDPPSLPVDEQDPPDLLLFLSASRGDGCLTRDGGAQSKAWHAGQRAAHMGEKREAHAGAEGGGRRGQRAQEKSKWEKRPEGSTCFFLSTRPCPHALALFPAVIGTVFSFQRV